MSERPRLVPASYVVFRRADQVLLQLRQGTGYMDGCWAAAAAGHLEAGESAVQAAVREAQEELGITIDPEQLVPLTTMHRSNGATALDGQRVDFFFSCELWHGEPRLMEPDKAADLGWFPLDGLPHPVVPHERYVFERLAAGLPALTTFGFDTV
ncbi:NUDIX hydrolase [Arthrobacter rhombi]|uniref:NUDIX hydrolase n=1 Tax=Arthrobacter rhombi TaxID=71253 RepID=UPI003FD1D52F